MSDDIKGRLELLRNEQAKLDYDTAFENIKELNKLRWPDVLEEYASPT